MTEIQWARQAWLLALDTQADDLVWEQNLAGPTMRRVLEAAWRRIVRQVRTLESLAAPKLDPFTGREGAPLDLTRPEIAEEIVRHAANLWAAEEQRLPITEVKATDDDRRELSEILLRLQAGQFDGILDTPPARLVAVTATQGKRTRATPVATAYETNAVSHVGTLPEYEQELTHWEEGMASPGRLDAGVWLVTHLRAARRARTSTSAGTTLPGTTPR